MRKGVLISVMMWIFLLVGVSGFSLAEQEKSTPQETVISATSSAKGEKTNKDAADKTKCQKGRKKLVIKCPKCGAEIDVQEECRKQRSMKKMHADRQSKKDLGRQLQLYPTGKGVIEPNQR